MRAPNRLLSASVALAVLGVGTSARAVTPVFKYHFPTSYDGTSTTVTDQSPAGHDGAALGSSSATRPPLAAAVPPGATGNSITTNAGGLETTATRLLDNASIAANGGFTFQTAFMWDGTARTTFSGVQKILDYSGTESLQIETTAGNNTTALLHFIFTAQGTGGGPDVVTGPSIPISANTWYQATGVFDTLGSAVDANGFIPGLATVTATDLTNGGAPVSANAPVTKTNYAETTLNRPIGIGELPLNSTSSRLVTFDGDIYDPAVSLGVVPEPAALALLGLAFPAAALRRRRKQ